jgi:hypothetical protein
MRAAIIADINYESAEVKIPLNKVKFQSERSDKIEDITSKSEEEQYKMVKRKESNKLIETLIKMPLF